MTLTYDGFDFVPINFDPDEDKWDDMSQQPLKFAALKYDKEAKTLEVLDQLLLPTQTRYIRVRDVGDTFAVIRNMNVRGAPLIATVALLGLAVDLEHSAAARRAPSLVQYARAACARLRESRPTAVNLSNEVRALDKFLDSQTSLDRETVKRNVQERSYQLYVAERVENDLLLRHATICVEKNVPAADLGGQLNVLTVCNTGALATSSFGTALGVIKALHDRHHLGRAYCLETRPYLQGARLTAYELQQQRIPHTLLADGMAASLMRQTRIHAVLVGADQVARNGDTANKIGTYMLAVLARHHRVPFYVVAPTASINARIATGDMIQVEERPADELRKLQGAYIAPPETPVWNPAFDVTPSHLITAILTERGCVRPSNVPTLFCDQDE